MTTSVNHLDKLAIVQLDFHLWCGKVKLDDPDIKLGDGGELPPKTIADLGNKKIIDPKHLTPFSRLKSAARRLCLTKGMSFMNGFAIPVNDVDEIIVELNKMSHEMNTLKTKFMNNYDQYIQDWLQENAEYVDIISKGVLPASIVKNKLSFNFSIFQVDPVNPLEATKLEGMATGLVDDLMKEIMKESDAFFHSNLKGGDSCSPNSKKSLIRIRDKVDGLSFLDSKFLSVVKLLDEAVLSYPVSGRLIGEPFYKVLSASLILSSQDKFNDYASGAVDLDDVASRYMFSENIVPEVNHSEQLSIVDIEAIDDALMDDVDSNISVLDDDDEMDAFFRNHQSSSSDSSFF